MLEPKKNPHKIVEYACDKCEFKIKSKAKLIMHENATHKIIELDKEIKTSDKNLTNSEHKTDTFVDYDNLDSDDDDIDHKKNESKLLKRKREGTNLPSRKKTKEGKYSCDECIFKTTTKKSLIKHKENSCEQKLE